MFTLTSSFLFGAASTLLVMVLLKHHHPRHTFSLVLCAITLGFLGIICPFLEPTLWALFPEKLPWYRDWQWPNPMDWWPSDKKGGGNA